MKHIATINNDIVIDIGLHYLWITYGSILNTSLDYQGLELF